MDVARRLAETYHGTCGLSSEGTFLSILTLSARASHMAKARVKGRKPVHGKVMSREGRKEEGEISGQVTQPASGNENLFRVR